MSDKNFTKAKLKEHILSVSKYSREILESKNVIFLCVCCICNNLWTVCNHCSLCSHPEHQSTWDLQTPHWSGGLQRIHSGLNSLEKCCSPDSPTSARQRRSVRVRKGGISCNYYLLRLSRQFVGDKGRAAESGRPSYQANLIVSVALCNPELFRRQASSFKHTADGKY